MTVQLTIQDAIALKERGMQRAVAHAERIEPGWKELALSFLKEYAQTYTNFQAEDVRAAAVGIVPEPPHLRAWGSVMQTAAKRGWIVAQGFSSVSNPTAHAAFARTWRSTFA